MDPNVGDDGDNDANDNGDVVDGFDGAVICGISLVHSGEIEREREQRGKREAKRTVDGRLHHVPHEDGDEMLGQR